MTWAGLETAVQLGLAEFGHLDILSANAGILSQAPSWELSEADWQEMIDINLTGGWKTTRAVIPPMLAQGTGGSIILTRTA